MLWSLLRLVQRPSGLRFIIAAACWAALVLMHNLSALLLLPIIGIFVLVLIFFPDAFDLTPSFGVACRPVSQTSIRPQRRPPLRSRRGGTGGQPTTVSSKVRELGEVPRFQRLLLPLAALACGTLLVAFHVLPFVLDAGDASLALSTRDPSLQPVSYPVQLSDLLASPPIFDVGIDNNATGYSIGLLHILAIIIGAFAVVALWRSNHRAEAALVGLLCAFALLMIWMQTEAATFVWKALPPLAILQFRVRLLSVIGMIAAIVLGYGLCCWPASLVRWRGAVTAALIVAFIVPQLPSLYPQLMHRYTTFSSAPTVAEGQAWATANHTPGFTLTTVGEFLPRWRTDRFSDEDVPRIAASPIDNLPDGAQITTQARRTGNLQMTLQTPKAFDAAFHVLYFPGWAGYVNGQPQPLQPVQGTGYILMSVPAGIESILLRYEGTLAQHTGDLISAVMVLVLLMLAVVWRKPSALASTYTDLRPRWWIVMGIILLVGLKGYIPATCSVSRSTGRSIIRRQMSTALFTC